MDVSIIGTGYVGLVTGACLAAIGHRVVCVDNSEARLTVVAEGRAPFVEPGLDEILARAVADGALRATNDLAGAVLASEVTIIAVGTPERDGEIDLSQVSTAARQIGEALRGSERYHVVAVKSTVVPGSTEGVVLPALEAASGRKVGVELGLCMNPEFLRESEAVTDFINPDRIVIGSYDDRARQRLSALYETFECPKLFTSLVNAEFIKYASNAYLAANISFANEIANLCEATDGADADVVFAGVHLDRRLSPLVASERISPGILGYLKPSSGYGGSCLPKDIAALRGFAKSRRVATPLLDGVAGVNETRGQRVLDALEDRVGSVTGLAVSVLGLAFKAGTDDLRHSPAIDLAMGLVSRGACLTVHDPVATQLARPLLGEAVTYAADALTAADGADVIAIGAAWPQWRELDWRAVARRMRGNVLFDARNALTGVALPGELRCIRIGAGRPRDPAER